jgi:hypothetical protein
VSVTQIAAAPREEARARGEIDASSDPAQMAFELSAVLELANHLAMLYEDPAAVERGRAAGRRIIRRR